MKRFIKNNINILISIFILLQPILDLVTGISIHVLENSITLGIVLKVLFIFFLMYTSLFIYQKKKLLIYYLIIIIYGVGYTLGMLIYKDSSLFLEMQNLVKTFYFPVLLITIYYIKDEIKISNMVLFSTLFIYLICIFVPTIFQVGYKTYEITKAGTLGFFNSANEISGIISILTPIIFIIFKDEKNIIKKTTLSLIYLIVILMMGTKSPLLALLITIFFNVVYLLVKSIKKRQYKPIIFTFLALIILLTSLIFVIPKTNFYKNIETHLNYLEVDNILDIFKDEKLVDHFIFSQRLTFLEQKAKIYSKANIYEKLFGIGYINNNKNTKLIEMDYFDIFYSHGIIGFLLFFEIYLMIIYLILIEKQKLTYERYMLLVSFILILFLSFFTGHIITAPSVSLISAIIIYKLAKRPKKDLLFTSVSMDIGGIEKALLNLVNRIDYDKYNVTIILENKKGIFLNQIIKKALVKELKVSDNNNKIIRKITNFKRKYIYKILNYKNYDFSCCYATYSYSSSKLVLLSSNNTAFYVHNDYRTIYPKEKDFRYFFDSRNISQYRNIIFVSNENKKGFVEIYNNLKDKCKVYNNFININEIKKLSEEKLLPIKKNNSILFVYVGRLDDAAKKISRQINLVKEIKEIELWIVGDGPDREKYESEVKKYNLENRVIFFGKQKNPYNYMKAANYIILTSDYEGFPVIYLEAIALNKKIITTYPTSDDKINLNDYSYVIPKDEKAMIKKVKEILKNKDEVTSIDLEDCQNKRMQQLENIFDEVV